MASRITGEGLQSLDIGASFWALVLGVFISLVFETKDFEFIRRAAHEPSA
ncbi:hypothetical protein [Halomonas smyrnensis]|nr:hypothetical protein [Halomonas smyrnensis]